MHSYTANGNIVASTIVKFDAATPAPFRVIQASAATDHFVGIAQEFTDFPPLSIPQIGSFSQYAAIANENCKVYTDNDECSALVSSSGGAAVTVGDALTAGADGGVLTTTTADNWLVGRAIDTVSNPGLVRTLVLIGVYR